MEPIYLVCGFPRSGTSMMMRALEAGGMTAVYDEGFCMGLPSTDPAYHPNPHGYYELGNREHRAEHAGKVIKCLNRNIRGTLNPNFQYRAVYMIRNPVEIERSYRLTIPHGKRTFGAYYADVYDDIRLLELIRADVTSFYYANVVERPLEQLSRLKWPFDPIAAAKTIDPALYRNRAKR